MKTINEHLYLAVPVGSKNVQVHGNTYKNQLLYTRKDGYVSNKETHVPIDLEFICLASEMTEEVAKSMGFVSLESFHSLMEVNEMYLVNPMGKEPIVYEFNHTVDFLNKHNIWQSYQNKLSDYVILKIK